MALPASVVDHQVSFYNKLSKATQAITAGSRLTSNLPVESSQRLTLLLASQGELAADNVSPTSKGSANITSAQQERGSANQQNHLDLTSSDPHPPVPQNPDSSQPVVSGPSNNVPEPSPTKNEVDSSAKPHREYQYYLQKRQQLENKLKEQFKKPNVGEKREDLGCFLDGPITFDTLEVFERAVAFVNATEVGPTQADANATVSSNSPFDENSYYSSQVNERWSSISEGAVEEGEIESRAEASAGDTRTYTADKQDENIVANPPSRTITESQRPYSKGVQPVDSSNQRVRPKSARRGRAEGRGKFPCNSTEQSCYAHMPAVWLTMPTDARLDESYSPPSPGAFKKLPPSSKPHGRGTSTPRGVLPQVGHQHSNQYQRYRRDSESYSPPSAPVPIVQNHIGEPVAPQPSRISPLAGRHNGDLTNGDHGGIANSHTAFASNNSRALPRDASAHQARQRQVQQQNQRQPYGDTLQRSKRGPRNDERIGNHQDVFSASTGRRYQELDNNGGRRDVYSQRHPNPRDHPHESEHRPAQQRPPPVEPYIKPEPTSPPPLTTFPVAQNSSRNSSYNKRPHPEPDFQAISPRNIELPRATRPGPLELGDAYYEKIRGVNRSNRGDPPPPRQVGSSVYNGSNLRRIASVQSANQVSPREWQQERGHSTILSSHYQMPDGHESSWQLDSGGVPPTWSSPQSLPPPAKKRHIILPNGEEWMAVPVNRNERQSAAPEPRSIEYHPRQVDNTGNYSLAYPLPSRESERPRRRRIIEIDDDDDYQAMPPPTPARAMSRAEVDSQLRRALNGVGGQRSRASPPSPTIIHSREVSYEPRYSNHSYEANLAPRSQQNYTPPSPIFERPRRYYDTY